MQIVHGKDLHRNRVASSGQGSGDPRRHLGSFHGAVLAIGGGRGFGPFMGDQLAQIGSTDQTFLYLQPLNLEGLWRDLPVA